MGETSGQQTTPQYQKAHNIDGEPGEQKTDGVTPRPRACLASSTNETANVRYAPREPGTAASSGSTK